MNVSSIGSSSALSGGHGVKHRPDPLTDMLKDALSSGQITQKQYDDTVKELTALKTQMKSSDGTPPSKEDMDAFRQKADAILQKVGLKMPEPPSRGKPPDADSDTDKVSSTSGTSNDWVQVLLNLLKTKTSETGTNTSTVNATSALQGGAISLLA